MASRDRGVKAEWVVAGGKPGESGHCTRCGRGIGLPSLPIPVYVAAMDAFVELHSTCQPGQFHEKPVTTAEEWAHSRDTGVSSMTIWAVMTGNRSRYDHYDIPHDPDDFGRCYRLLRKFPSWKSRLREVADRFPDWKPFVREWDAMTALYEEELTNGTAPKLYELMKSLRGSDGL